MRDSPKVSRSVRRRLYLCALPSGATPWVAGTGQLCLWGSPMEVQRGCLGDEVLFLAHSELGPPGLLIWCSLWESQLLLTWQIWFALGPLPCPFQCVPTSTETCPGLASWEQGPAARVWPWTGPEGGRPLQGRLLCLRIMLAESGLLLPIMPTHLSLQILSRGPGGQL